MPKQCSAASFASYLEAECDLVSRASTIRLRTVRQNHSMSLTLVELEYPAGERFWFPFTDEEAGLGFNEQWWHNPV